MDGKQLIITSNLQFPELKSSKIRNPKNIPKISPNTVDNVNNAIYFPLLSIYVISASSVIAKGANTPIAKPKMALTVTSSHRFVVNAYPKLLIITTKLLKIIGIFRPTRSPN